VKSRAAVFHGHGRPLEVREIELEEPRPTDVLVRMSAVGICGTELHSIRGEWERPTPSVLGHEGAGVVEAVGEDVTAVKAGDHVVCSWNPHCGHCFYCERDQPILCEPFTFNQPRGHLLDGKSRLSCESATVHHFSVVSSHAQYAVVPQSGAIKVPKEIPFDRACLIGCGVMTGVGAAVRLARVEAGASVAVIGCGAVGLSVVQGARLAGASEIRALDLDRHKREQAIAFGATDTEPGPVDYAFDVVGRQATFEQGLSLLAAGGTYVLIGLSPAGERGELDLPRLFAKRSRILVSHGGDHVAAEDFPRLAAWALEGKLDLERMVTRVGPLDEWQAALDAMQGGEVVRTVLTP